MHVYKNKMLHDQFFYSLICLQYFVYKVETSVTKLNLSDAHADVVGIYNVLNI